ncbi:MAG: phosphoenolpyruvate--protein phosphotransferase [Paracoccus sp. (in: a-proteobacteria)]|uniref:phosphoenolpyruvate--protein phosphotransferase n=1 Tax=Paracoccus sp. TaxID=267 RepID=UPI0026E0AD99|nr:phosphoenolpyruvate--protein phosphotransferase [Paracoccus sp. (in: a-proteobacteria)]MDO5620281.1 phosphoenolpyruvate--protein phosphotransferase [Paracoccus sp. (in: a-proteobacteria)]
MKLFGMFGSKSPDSKPEPKAEPAQPAPDLSPISGPVTVAAPVSGQLLVLADVPDPVFAEKVLGDGFAIDPVADMLVAPFDGTVISLPATGHAVTLRARNGAEVLMHIGIDTVGLNGKGFRPQVREGDAVRQGQALIGFDRNAIAAQVPSMVIPVILTNEGFTLTDLAAPGAVAVGDAALTLTPEGAATETPAATTGEAVRVEAVLIDPFGLHARPAGIIAQHAKSAPVGVSISLNGKTVDARSPIALMTLGAAKGDRLTIAAAGPEGREAVQAIADFIASFTPETGTATPAPEAPSAAPVAAPVTAAAPLLAMGEALDFSGASAVPGLGIGQSLRLVQAALEVPETGRDPAAEGAALTDALNLARQALRNATTGANHTQTAIMEAHLSFLDDAALQDAAKALIEQGKSAAFAWKTALDEQITTLRSLGNAVMAERASDLADVQRRVVRLLTGQADSRVTLTEPTVVFAEDLLPSQFAELDPAQLAGICLAASGPTAHIAILAGARGVPMVVAAGPDAMRVPDGQSVILEGETGTLRINPPAADLDSARSRAEARRQRAAESRANAAETCHMADGTRIEVMANLGQLADVAPALEAGAEGSGLLRSEFLYLDRATAPTEEEQFQQYQAIADALDGRPLVIRTLDAGADKDVPYVQLPADENPALGLRGIRMSLFQPELLRDQIRAILRVKPYGVVKLLLPMIATLEDLRNVRAVIDAEMAALGRAEPIELGVMVEVPSVALLSARFADEVDFFSIGTNDLTQYALAMDRINPRLAPQLDPFHPAVLHLIALTAQGAAAKGRWIGVCGNLASFPLAAPVLIGLGVTELSASAGALPEIKAMVRGLDMATCRDAAEAALKLEDAAQVRAMLAERFPGH